MPKDKNFSRGAVPRGDHVALRGISATIVIIIIITVLIIAGGIYWWTKKPVSAPTDVTTNWQTFKNAEYGFEFKYPNDLTIIDGKNSDPSMLLNKFISKHNRSNNDAVEIAPDYSAIILRVFDNPQKLTTEQWLSKNFPEVLSWDKTLSKLKLDMTFQGQESKSVAYQGYIAYIQKGNIIINIFNSMKTDNQKISDERFNQILTTFKFTK